jgi:hypothetical protein
VGVNNLVPTSLLDTQYNSQSEVSLHRNRDWLITTFQSMGVGLTTERHTESIQNRRRQSDGGRLEAEVSLGESQAKDVEKGDSEDSHSGQVGDRNERYWVQNMSASATRMGQNNANRTQGDYISIAF